MGNVGSGFHRGRLYSNALGILEIWPTNSREQSLSRHILSGFPDSNREKMGKLYTNCIPPTDRAQDGKTQPH